ncbi:zinc finger protein HD1 [Dendrobium catenatum]|uniref:zinc finger protein HD1 n=1 Tax=Dendrobium catenatum TaxID=906689 RepID=UPI0010A06021|nr:zinc finger protein HD1 [Dendrobium catenatum]
MKKCELCKLPANIHCESDQAILCWECDAKVHEANFLVARHSRNLLCRRCQAPTPWKSSGSRLSYSVSVCERCEAFQEDSVVTDEEEEGENKLVPLRISPPPDFGSSNGVEAEEIGDTAYIGFESDQPWHALSADDEDSTSTGSPLIVKGSLTTETNQ